MNIDFNILWFEDNDEWYESIKSEIEDYIINRSFRPKFERYKNIPSDLEKLIKSPFDLIFVDLNLAYGDMGYDALKRIRDKEVLADALFYSTDGVEKIKELLKQEVLEGAYSCMRNEYLFPDKAKSLIDKTVKRAEDILNIRGLLMDKVSEFDENLKEIIRNRLSIAEEEEINDLNMYAYEKVCKQIQNNTELANKCNEDRFILKALEETFLLDSYKLSMIVNKIFKDKFPEFDKMKGFHDDFNSKILKERNKLAHAKTGIEQNDIFYFQDENGDKIVYDSEKCKEIRANINFYSELLSEAIRHVLKI